MPQKQRRRPVPRTFVVVCMRETSALPELVLTSGVAAPLSARTSILIGRMGQCVPYALEEPCAHATERLKRHVCDRHNRPIVVVPEGSIPQQAGGGGAS